MAQALLETTSFRYKPMDRAEFDRHIQIAHDQLGEARFEALVSEDHAMTTAQAFAKIAFIKYWGNRNWKY